MVVHGRGVRKWWCVEVVEGGEVVMCGGGRVVKW